MFAAAAVPTMPGWTPSSSVNDVISAQPSPATGFARDPTEATDPGLCLCRSACRKAGRRRLRRAAEEQVRCRWQRRWMAAASAAGSRGRDALPGPGLRLPIVTGAAARHRGRARSPAPVRVAHRGRAVIAYRYRAPPVQPGGGTGVRRRPVSVPRIGRTGTGVVPPVPLTGTSGRGAVPAPELVARHLEARGMTSVPGDRRRVPFPRVDGAGRPSCWQGARAGQGHGPATGKRHRGSRAGPDHPAIPAADHSGARDAWSHRGRTGSGDQTGVIQAPTGPRPLVHTAPVARVGVDGRCTPRAPCSAPRRSGGGPQPPRGDATVLKLVGEAVHGPASCLCCYLTAPRGMGGARYPRSWIPGLGSGYPTSADTTAEMAKPLSGAAVRSDRVATVVGAGRASAAVVLNWENDPTAPHEIPLWMVVDGLSNGLANRLGSRALMVGVPGRGRTLIRPAALSHGITGASCPSLGLRRRWLPRNVPSTC